MSTASMVLTVPATGGTLETQPQQKPGLTNPLLQFNDALRTTAGILILATNTPEVAAELGVKEGGPTALTINDGRTNPDLLGISTNGPFVYVEVESTSPAVVRDVMRKAQQRVRVELARRQTALDAPVSTHIGILDVMPASVPKPVIQDRLLASAGGGLFGVVAGFGVAYGVRRVKAARHAHAHAHAHATAPEPEPELRREPRPELRPEPEGAVGAGAAASNGEGSNGKAADGEVAWEDDGELRNGSKSQVATFPVFTVRLPDFADDDTRPIQAIKVEDD
ncbi:hypothetical protein [Nonomuraea sp. NPDC049480]|uniref:hypothetical protein n=1 Tax=Nonomuraea sp. NPDC049480 TaxID=3364353 RepID=UPI0037A41A6D